MFNMVGYKNRIVGRPVVAGYNWILSIATIFEGRFLKKKYYGTNVAPILANIFAAMLENELLKTCKLDPNCNYQFYSIYSWTML